MSMHADEESDEGVVPMKRSNNEGVSSAETVEGRTSPKGNGGQTAAARTLRRGTASNGLIAVRRAARQSKTVRFTALLHHITTDLLKRSYHALEDAIDIACCLSELIDQVFDVVVHQAPLLGKAAS